MSQNYIYLFIEAYSKRIRAFLGRVCSEVERKSVLQIRRQGGKVRYFLRDKETGKDKYLSATKVNVIFEYAKLELSDKLRKEETAFLEALEKCLKILEPFKDPNGVYESLPLERREILGRSIPIVDVADWLNRPPWRRKPFREGETAIETVNGMYVRSKSEDMIVRVLIELGVPFIYEYPIRIDGQNLYPDFHVLNTRTGEEFVYEHFGGMDNPKYVEEQFLWKLKQYEKVGLTFKTGLVATFETKNKPLNEKELREFVKKHFL